MVYDHECTGQSHGDTKSVMFSHWYEDAEKVIDRLTEGPVLLVGSSLGGWLSLLVAREMEERLHSLGMNKDILYINDKHTRRLDRPMF